ncbi:MAG: NAD-dependent epimerase/dehydratase family protein [Deltaproteobacteria bacterium]|nr:NAD-dependent epimerase/dehydratase family protein [Deltaproteobacteria bacterium]
MSRTVLVTGAAGFIGSHVCERLVAAGDRVVGLDNFHDFYDPSMKRENLAALAGKDSFELVEADVCDVDAVCRAFEAHSPGVVVHLAARAGVRPSIEDPRGYVRTNIDGTMNVLEAAAAGGVRRFVFASSSSVYGNTRAIPFSEEARVDQPISPYAATKKAGELLCHAWSHLNRIPLTCLRFFTVYGPRQRPDLAIYRFLRRVARKQAIPVYGDGTSSRDYTFITDIVDGVMAAMGLDDGFRVYNLGGSSPVTLAGLIGAVEEVTGCEAVIDRLPSQPGDVDMTFADLRRSRDDLGYEPEVSLIDGLRMQFDWMKRHDRI